MKLSEQFTPLGSVVAVMLMISACLVALGSYPISACIRKLQKNSRSTSDRP